MASEAFGRESSGELAEGTAAEMERRRIAALRSTDLLDTERELEFDQVIELAAGICGTPIGAFTLVDETRQWIKAAVGLGIQEVPREHSFCSRAIEQRELFVVEDARLDARFADNPEVMNDPAVRFYAGMPLAGPDGYLLGTLCVVDVVPRQLTESQRTALRILATQLQSRVELRVQRRRLEEALASRESLVLALQRSDDRFRTFMNNAPFLSYIKDAKGRFMFYNRRLAEQFQIGMAEWLGRSAMEIWPSDMAQVYEKNDLEAMRSDEVFEIEEETRDASGAATFWRSFKFAFWNERGERLLGGFASEITAEVMRRRSLETTNATLERFATVDGLTGLVNRRVLDERMREEFARTKLQGKAFSIVLLDLDNFKRRNDTYGHTSGDDALRQMGSMLGKMVRATDVAGRYGGEEMLLMLPGTDLQGAMLLARRVQRAMRAAVWPDEALTASFGVAAMEGPTDTIEDLVTWADAAMYRAKRAGKDRVVGHGAGRNRRMTERPSDAA